MSNPLSGKDKLLSLRSAAFTLAAGTRALTYHKAQEFLKNNHFTTSFPAKRNEHQASVDITEVHSLLYIRNDPKKPRIHPISNLKSKFHESPKPPFF